MKRTTDARRKKPRNGVYFPKVVPMAAIQRFARQIVVRFDPEKIILFGSYAHGTPTPHSDVDLLVVMATRNQVEQSGKFKEDAARRSS
jgi:predicted nucleotidyltransferase